MAAGRLRPGRAPVRRRLRQVAPADAKPLEPQSRAATPGPGRAPAKAESRLAEQARLTRALLAARAPRPEPEARAACEAVAQVLAGNAETAVSFVDPDARWEAKRDTQGFEGYKVHRSLDPDSQLISDVETLPGTACAAVARAAGSSPASIRCGSRVR